MLKGKTVVLGVTGGIAAYKAANLASFLVKNHADVRVIMTKNACNIINPIAFETLTSHKCLIDTFDRNFEFSVSHISLAKLSDCFIVAPATANFIGKAAHGIADDMLSTTWLAYNGPKIVSPAMNTGMFENPVVQDNIETLKKYGVKIVEPESGHLACGDSGKGKFPETEVLFDAILDAVSEKDLKGKKVVVTAGPTREKLDPVRFLTNHSTGKMGFEIARAAFFRGAEVVLVSGPVSSEVRKTAVSGMKVIDIESAQEMFESVKKESEDAAIIIKAAAVADFTPAKVSEEKIKKSAEEKASGETTLLLKGTTDILKYLGNSKKNGQKIIGFAMETENVIENAQGKLHRKNVDMICANSLRTEGAGFGGNTNVVTIITKDGVIELPKMTKFEVADRILDEIKAL